MVIRNTPRPRRKANRSCLLTLIILALIPAAFWVIANANAVRDMVLPDPTPTATKSPASYATSATLYERDREYENAIDAYRNAIELNPTQVDYYIRLINLLVLTDQPAEALDLAKIAVDIAPDNAEVWTVKAAAHLKYSEQLDKLRQNSSEEYARAVDAGRNAIQVEPTNGLAYAYVAEALIQQGWESYAEAQDMADNAFAYAPNNAEVLYHYANVLSAQGYYDVARRHLENAVEIDPNYMPIYTALGQIYFWSDNRPRAINTIKDAIELDPDNAELYDTLAYFYLVVGEASQAEDNAAQALRHDPDMVIAQAHLGWALFKQNNYERAIEELDKAVAAYGDPTPTNALFFSLLGLAQYRLDAANCDIAIPLFNAALEVSEIGYPAEINATEGLSLCRQAGLGLGN